MHLKLYARACARATDNEELEPCSRRAACLALQVAPEVRLPGRRRAHQRETVRILPQLVAVRQEVHHLLGNDERVPTQLFNGYGEFVADLYKGMENERLFM